MGAHSRTEMLRLRGVLLTILRLLGLRARLLSILSRLPLYKSLVPERRPLLKPRTSSFKLGRPAANRRPQLGSHGAHGGQGARARTATGHRRRGCDAGDHAGRRPRRKASCGSHPASAADSAASPDHRWACKRRKAKGRRHVARGAGGETNDRSAATPP